MARATYTGELDFTVEWKKFWEINRLVPSFTDTRVQRATPLDFDDDDSVIINQGGMSEGQQKFMGVVVVPQGINGYYLLDTNEGMLISEILPNFRFEECMVHVQSFKTADDTTILAPEVNEEGDGESVFNMGDPQQEGEDPLTRRSLDGKQDIYTMIEPQTVQFWQRTGSDDINRLEQEHQQLAREAERLIAESTQLKDQQRLTQQKLQKAHEDLQWSQEQCESKEQSCSSLYEQIIQLHRSVATQKAQINKLDTDLIQAIGQREVQRDVLVKSTKQRDHDIYLLTREVSELKKKLQSTETREHELSQKLQQSRGENSYLKQQLEDMNGQVDFLDAMRAY